MTALSGTLLASLERSAPTSTNLMRSNLYPPAALGHVLAESSEELWALAAWYHHYAEQAGSTVIWDYRLSTAEDLERQASALELGKRTQETRTAPSQTTAMRPASRFLTRW